MNKKVSIATLSAFLVATSPAMAVNEANTLYVNLELSLNRTTVGLVIQSISEQTGYEFSYDESILSKEISKVSVRVKNEHIESVLKKVFKNTDISYRIDRIESSSFYPIHQNIRVSIVQGSDSTNTYS